MISLVIFPVAAALAVLLKRRFEETVFPAIGLLTVSMLLAVAIGKTALAPYFSVVYLVAAIVLLIVFRAGIKKYVLTPGFAAFCVYYAFFILFSFGRFFNTDAALSQYAPSVYHLFNKQTLLDDCLFYDLNNPFPFGTLWALFCNGKGERLQEWLCIFASDILIVSGFLPLFTQIESIKKETWQWIAMLFAVLFFPLLKYTGAYSSFDMVYPQTAVMAYTYILFYHIVCEKQKKGDILLAAFGLFWSCTLSGYGIYTVVPLLIGISAVIILQPKRHIKLIPIVAVAFVATLLCSLFSYSLGSTEGVDWKTVSGVYLGCLLTGGIISAAMLLYRKGYQKVSLMVILALLAVSTGVMVLSLQHGVNRENAVERFLGYTGRLFEGNNEHTIGKNFLPFSDMVFLFALWGLSGMIDIRLKKQSKKATDRVKTFRISYELGIVIYFMVLCVLYVNEIWMVNADKAPSVLPYVAPCIILSAVGLFMKGLLTWKKDVTLAVGTVFLTLCVYSDPVGGIFDKPEKENPYPLIRSSVEQGEVAFGGEDRVFYIDRDLLSTLPVSFRWEVFPAGAESISGMYYNPDAYKWSGGEIGRNLTAEELAELIKKRRYTYVYIKHVDDFFIETYYPDFDNWGADIKDDALYHVEYDEDGQLQIKYVTGGVQEDGGEG